jgi:hypothetical protein
MIQRIQSVYLLLTTLLSGLFLNGSFLTFVNKAGAATGLSFKGISVEAAGVLQVVEKTIPVSILMIIIPVIALVAIFLYKNRILQMRIVMGLIVLTSLLLIFSAYYAYDIMNQYDSAFVPGIKMVLPVLLLILSILAYRGIKKDEELVKSYDRLR